MDRFLRETPSSQLERCMAYFRVEPWGQDWLQTATMAAAAINPHIKRSIPVRDFIPKYIEDEAPGEATEEQFNATVESLASTMSMMGGF